MTPYRTNAKPPLAPGRRWGATRWVKWRIRLLEMLITGIEGWLAYRALERRIWGLRRRW